MPRRKTTVKRGTIQVARYYGLPVPLEEKNVEPQTIEVREFLTDAAQVHVERGVSIEVSDGAGEWQTVRIGVTLPCYVEEIEDAKEQALYIAQEEVARQRALIFGAAADEFNLMKPPQLASALGRTLDEIVNEVMKDVSSQLDQ